MCAPASEEDEATIEEWEIPGRDFFLFDETIWYLRIKWWRGNVGGMSKTDEFRSFIGRTISLLWNHLLRVLHMAPRKSKKNGEGKNWNKYAGTVDLWPRANRAVGKSIFGHRPTEWVTQYFTKNVPQIFFFSSLSREKSCKIFSLRAFWYSSEY